VTFVRCSPILKERKAKQKQKQKPKNPTKQPITSFAVAGQKYVKKRKRDKVKEKQDNQ